MSIGAGVELSIPMKERLFESSFFVSASAGIAYRYPYSNGSPFALSI
jgi:hypothetical protein